MKTLITTTVLDKVLRATEKDFWKPELILVAEDARMGYVGDAGSRFDQS